MANDEKMSRQEAGRKGGEATSKNHDKDFYREIGQKAEKPLRIIMIRNSIRKLDKRAGKPR